MKPKRRGAPPFVPTREQRQTVQVLSANGDPQRVIAKNIGIDEKTLRKHFAEELANGLAHVRAAVGGSVVRAALNGNIYAAKYWLSTHGGPEWRVVEGRVLGGMEDAVPIPVSTDAKVTVYLPDNGRTPRRPAS
jgi:hypothetical protein